MKKEGWINLVIEAVREHDAGDSEKLDLLGRLLEEQDQAKQMLRDRGYGVTGTPWIDTVSEVESIWLTD